METLLNFVAIWVLTFVPIFVAFAIDSDTEPLVCLIKTLVVSMLASLFLFLIISILEALNKLSGVV